MSDKIILIGGSAGSLQAIFRILEIMRPAYPFPLILVLHRQNSNDSLLVELLTGKSDLKPREIEEKDKIEPGYIYICPPDYHVLIESDETFSLDTSEKVNYSRPSLDVVFASAAGVFRERLVGVVLSGANNDGAEGLLTIKEKGGLIIVQDPTDAQVAYMPLQALELTKTKNVLTSERIAELLNGLAD